MFWVQDGDRTAGFWSPVRRPLQKFHMNMFQNHMWTRVITYVNTCDYICEHVWLHVWSHVWSHVILEHVHVEFLWDILTIELPDDSDGRAKVTMSNVFSVLTGIKLQVNGFLFASQTLFFSISEKSPSESQRIIEPTIFWSVKYIFKFLLYFLVEIWDLIPLLLFEKMIWKAYQNWRHCKYATGSFTFSYFKLK